eukprot:5788388-Amphidinium_carterae.1
MRHANVFDNAYFVAMLTHGWRMQLPPHGITVEADRRWSRSDVANQDAHSSQPCDGPDPPRFMRPPTS